MGEGALRFNFGFSDEELNFQTLALRGLANFLFYSPFSQRALSLRSTSYSLKNQLHFNILVFESKL